MVVAAAAGLLAPRLADGETIRYAVVDAASEDPSRQASGA
jgi:hypothetical protein